MVYDLLQCQSRLFRLRRPNETFDICTLCDLHQVGDNTHSLIVCPYNGGAGHFILDKLHHVLPVLQPQQAVHLDYDVAQDI